MWWELQAELGDEELIVTQMASGFGKDGNISRCYGFWKNWSYCVAEKGYSRKCVPYRDDYLECLHHGKEVQREQALYHEWKFQEARKKAEESGAKPDHGHH